MLLLAFHLLRISFSCVGSSERESPCNSYSFCLIEITELTKSGVSYFFPGGKRARLSARRAIGMNQAIGSGSVVSDKLGFCIVSARFCISKLSNAASGVFRSLYQFNILYLTAGDGSESHHWIRKDSRLFWNGNISLMLIFFFVSLEELACRE